MDENLESPPQAQKENAVPTLQPLSPAAVPARLKVPKPFKYPERYTSPTDQMMSPVSKRLLGDGRTRKAVAAAAAAAAPRPLLPPKPVKAVAPTADSTATATAPFSVLAARVDI
ncbi:unnamed protein product [Cuscuta epithymum]|uniref:Uncharacterized protein n=1 Tax=Cuscuta epithymum TaxID=186058 RepID=A0AAV0D4E1_9ASTE|nr:unnamed protein product [Cuscuta epithymum]